MIRTLPRPSLRQLASGLAVVAVFVVLCWPTFRWMAERFDAHDSFYSHGWLVPFASGWLIWQRRAVWSLLPRHAAFSGLALLVPCLLIQVVATWWRLGFVAGFAMLGVIWGLVWVWWGRPFLWALRFPLLFLLFMVPLPGVLLIAVSFKMKLLAASLATTMLKLGGMPAVQAGSMIRVPGISVIVDDTCSGLRSLISLITLSTLWTALMPRHTTRWQRLTVVASSIPIAVVANMVRIILLVLLAAVYGSEAAEGFLHYGSGIVVFGVALVVLAWLSRTVEQWHWPSFGLNRSHSAL